MLMFMYIEIPILKKHTMLSTTVCASIDEAFAADFLNFIALTLDNLTLVERTF